MRVAPLLFLELVWAQPVSGFMISTAYIFEISASTKTMFL